MFPEEAPIVNIFAAINPASVVQPESLEERTTGLRCIAEEHAIGVIGENVVVHVLASPCLKPTNITDRSARVLRKLDATCVGTDCLRH